MDKDYFGRKNLNFILGLLAVFMIIGTFYDYQISSYFYNERNLFGRIFAAYGQFPVSLTMSIAGILMIKITDKVISIKTILSFFIAILLNAMAIIAATIDPMTYLNLSLLISIVIAFILLILGNYFILRATRGCSHKQIKKAIQFMLFVIIAQLIIINIIKVFWGRPRMRMIETTDGATFQPWYVIGSSMKEKLMALGIASEEFKSFPSGHSASATCIFLLLLLPKINIRFASKKNWLFRFIKKTRN